MKRSTVWAVFIGGFAGCLLTIPFYWLVAAIWLVVATEWYVPYDTAYGLFWYFWDFWKIALGGAGYIAALGIALWITTREDKEC